MQSYIEFIYLILVKIFNIILPSAIVLSTLSGSPVQPLSAAQIGKIARDSFVSITILDENNLPSSYGSGFFISEKRIVTNFHVISGATLRNIKVMSSRLGSLRLNRILSEDTLRDLAILEIESSSDSFLTLANSDNLNIGDKIYALGNPEGLLETFSDGIVSGLNRVDNLIQISAPISPGSSGGPILNSNGKVVGVAKSTLIVGQNLNFMVPSKSLIELNSLSPAIIKGAIARNLIAEAIYAHKSEFRDCYQRTLTSNYWPKGQVMTNFVIGPSGDIYTKKIEWSSLADPWIEHCILNVLKSIKFPKPRGGGMVEVRYPFRFKPTLNY